MILLDASTFCLLIREAEGDKVLRILNNSRVTTLTDYEIGNILCKETRIYKKLSPHEVKELARETKRILGSIIHVSTQPQAFEDTLEFAIREGLSYSDGSYIQTAKELNLVLATEDAVLAKAARKHVRTLDAKEILEGKDY